MTTASETRLNATDIKALLTSARHRAALLRTDFASFVIGAFQEITPGVDLLWGPYLDLVCARLADVMHGRRRRLIITLPPRHLKSVCVSVAAPAFFLGHYPGQEVMCVSYAQPLAEKFAADTYRLMRSAFYGELFGDVLKPERQALHALQTEQGGVRRATSLEGTATGLGAHLLIFDDPQKAGETFSEAIRKRTNEAYAQTFLSRGNVPEMDRVIIVMQRLHDDDFVAHVQGLSDDWEVINLPAIAEEDEDIPYETIFGKSHYRRRAGEALHPRHMSLQTLETRRRASGEAIFAAQYQQRPTPAGGGLVKLEWFKHYEEEDLPSNFDRIVQSWDTANTAEQRSDYSVCTTWGEKSKHIYLLHVLRGRFEYPDLRRKVIEQAQVWTPDIICIEDKASGTQLLQELRARNLGQVRAIKPVTDKENRMVNQTALIENGFVHLPEEAPWLDEFLHELEMFPNGKYDDQVDSTSQALDNLGKWTSGGGLFEFMRQESEALQALKAEIWVLKPPAGLNLLFGIDGVAYRLHDDGCFHLPRSEAVKCVNNPGWKRIAQGPPLGSDCRLMAPASV